MLFTFEAISSRFETLFSNWINKAELLGPIYNLYFGTKYIQLMYSESKFLSLAQALETYHRRAMKNYDLSEPEYLSRTKIIFESVPQQYQKWLEYKLKFSNQPHLSKRLEDIYEKYSDIINDLIPEKDYFIAKVRNTRNYLTHYDPSLKDKSAEYEELYQITKKLELLIELCLLTELGFSSDELKTMYSRFEIKRKYQ